MPWRLPTHWRACPFAPWASYVIVAIYGKVAAHLARCHEAGFD